MLAVALRRKNISEVLYKQWRLVCCRFAAVRPAGARGLATGERYNTLPKYDEAAEIGLRQLWPALLVLVTVYGVGLYINPVRTQQAGCKYNICPPKSI